jgi:hypothetical protein
MSNDWYTKKKDLQVAQQIMDEYAADPNAGALGIFEVVVDKKNKSIDFRIADWVLILAEYFHTTYGEEQGDWVTRRVITSCITKGHTMH